jgi:DnaA-homolog protein
MSSQQLTFDFGRKAAQRFETFFPGANKEAVASARAFADGDFAARVLVVHGPPGCGKTHLLNAVAHTMAARGLQVHVAPLDDWFEANPAPLPESADVIVIDGAHASFPPALEGAAFTWFNAHAARGAKIVTALRPPLSGSEIRDDLRTRLATGLVLRLLPLDDAGLKEALLIHAQARGIVLNDSVLQYLVTRFSRDMGTLTALLEGLDSLSLAEKRAISLPLLRTLVG